MYNETSSCCSHGSGCCTPKQYKKTIQIDFLYLDLSVCERCQGTDANLDGAIRDVSGILKSAGYEIKVNKVNVNSKELAEKYEFMSSPTIRVNGNDIDIDIKESCCKECGDLCGTDVECRTWFYEGVEYNVPPKAMIINSILREVYSGVQTAIPKKKVYTLPDNLRVFYEGIEEKKEK